MLWHFICTLLCDIHHNTHSLVTINQNMLHIFRIEENTYEELKKPTEMTLIELQCNGARMGRTNHSRRQ